MYVFNREKRNWLSHVTVFEAFNPDECQIIIEDFSLIIPQAATIGGNLRTEGATVDQDIVEDTAVRSSIIRWVGYNQARQWVFDRLSLIGLNVNEQYYSFQLTGMLEDLQFTEYDADVSSHYGWHQDIGPGQMASRKLSIVVQLSNPSDYDGGALMLKDGYHDRYAEQNIGSATYFPSWQLHQVTPITRGKRYSLVVWITGEPFR